MTLLNHLSLSARLLGLSIGLALLAGLAGCERSAQAPSTPSLAAPAVSTVVLPSPTAQPSPLPTSSPSAPEAAPQTPTVASGDPADLAQILRFESSPAALVDTGNFLQVYRANAVLRRYQTARWTYIIDPASHLILQIQPVDETVVQAGSPLGPDLLDQAARGWIAKAAPGVALDGLTPAHSMLDGNFIFRWEDRARPLLEDGLSYPFIQAALTASGDLLNFYNTLPLAP